MWPFSVTELTIVVSLFFPSEPTEARDSLDDSLHIPLCIATVLGPPGISSKGGS